MSSKNELQELREEYEKLGKPGNKIASALYEIAFNKWGKIRSMWMKDFKEDREFRLEKEDEVWSFLSEYVLHLTMYDPETGERLKKKDQLAWVFKDGLAEPGKGIKDFNNLMFLHMKNFLQDRFKENPVERHVKRVSKILRDSSYGFGNQSFLLGSHSNAGERWIGTGNEFYDLVVKVQRNHPPRKPPENVENQSRWWMFWSGEELEELVWFVLDESRQVIGETEYFLSKEEWRQIFKEILTFTESRTFSLSEEFDSINKGEIGVDDLEAQEKLDSLDIRDEISLRRSGKGGNNGSAAGGERIISFLSNLDEFEYRLSCLKLVCMNKETGKGKTDQEIASVLGKTRQTVSARWKKIDSKVVEVFGKNAGQELGLLRNFLAEGGPFCENENCVCHFKVDE